MSPARAQNSDQTVDAPLALNQNLADAALAQSVTARSKASYDPPGLALGASRLYLTATGKVQYDDNVYNTDADHMGDSEFTLEPHGQWQLSAGHTRLGLDATGSVQRFATLTTENADQYDLAATAALAMGRSGSVTLDGFVGRHRELRGTLGDIVVGAPSLYDLAGGKADLDATLGAVSLGGGGGATRLRYQPIALDGQTTVQDYRDRTAYTAYATAALPLTPGLKLALRGDFNAQAYRLASGGIDQNSHGLAVVGGVEFGINALISGALNLGYLAQTYSDATLPTVKGLTYGAHVIWNPTTLLTATLTGGRTLQQSPFFAQSGVLEDTATVQIDYELLRNLILSAAELVTIDDFRGTGRRDTRYVSNFAARYLISRHLELGLALGHRDQASHGPTARAYVGNSALIDLIVRR